MQVERGSKPKRPKRIFRLENIGGETRVWAHRRGKNAKEGRTYVKDFVKDESLNPSDHIERKNILSGIMETQKQELEQRYKALCAQYGNVVARQWIVRIPEIEHGVYYVGDYVVSQERIPRAKIADIYKYNPEQLPDSVQKEVQQLVAALKESYRRFLNEGIITDNHPLDLYGSANVIVTADGHIKYVDTGLAQTTYEHRIPWLLLERFVAHLAALDYIAHGDAEAVCADSLYQDLIRCYSKPDQQRLHNPKRIVNVLCGTPLDIQRLKPKT